MTFLVGVLFLGLLAIILYLAHQSVQVVSQLSPVDDLQPIDELETQWSEFYGKRDYMMSQAEHTLFYLLCQLYADQYFIFPQVKLDKIFYVKSPFKYQHQYLNHIDRKSVDFLLCQKNPVRPVVAIELDDHSHQTEKRKARDKFVEALFSTTQLPLVRIPCQPVYALEALKECIDPSLSLCQSEVTIRDY